ncbi:hypothetical protein SprV_0100097700 [Sparganum proliferum]
MDIKYEDEACTTCFGLLQKFAEIEKEIKGLKVEMEKLRNHPRYSSKENDSERTYANMASSAVSTEEKENSRSLELDMNDKEGLAREKGGQTRSQLTKRCLRAPRKGTESQTREQDVATPQAKIVPLKMTNDLKIVANRQSCVSPTESSLPKSVDDGSRDIRDEVSAGMVKSQSPLFDRSKCIVIEGMPESVSDTLRDSRRLPTMLNNKDIGTPCGPKPRQNIQREASKETEASFFDDQDGNTEGSVINTKINESFTDLSFSSPIASSSGASETSELEKNAQSFKRFATTTSARFSRKQNVVIKGAPESTATIPMERVKHDLDLLQVYAKALLRDGESLNVLKAFRMRKIQSASGSTSRPRPLKVILETDAQAQLLLQRKASLRSQHPEVFFQPNYEPKERIRMRELMMDLEKRRSGGETHLQIKNGRIIQVKRTFLWPKAVILTA